MIMQSCFKCFLIILAPEINSSKCLQVMMVESFLPNMTSSHTRAVETMVTQLTNCVNFLDHRLDELTPQCWKSQIQSAAS